MSHSMSVVSAAVSFLMPGRAFWPYSIGTILLIIGLMTILKNEIGQAQGMDKVLVFGRLCLAIPMGVFGADHFIATSVVARMVPSWIPGHYFWAYFVGVALIAAALSITLKRFSAPAAALLGVMILSFVLLIHVQNVVRQPDRLTLAVLMRDISFSAGAFAFALAQAAPAEHVRRGMTNLISLMIAVPTVLFGVEQFVHPELVPVVPLDLTMPSWIPTHVPLSYLTGAVLIVCGLCIIVHWKERMAAAWLGAFIVLVVLLVYLPIVLAKPSDIENGLNYFVDTLAFSGNALLLAGILPQETYASSLPEQDGSVVTLTLRS